MRLDDGIEIKEGKRERMRERENASEGLQSAWNAEIVIVALARRSKRGEQLKPKRHQSDELSCYSSTFTSCITRTHTHTQRLTDKSEKYPSHGILKNAKSWGNRQIICGIVIKLNASSPSSCCSSLLSKLQRVAESHFLFIIRLYGIQMFGNCSRKNGEQRKMIKENPLGKSIDCRVSGQTEWGQISAELPSWAIISSDDKRGRCELSEIWWQRKFKT